MATATEAKAMSSTTVELLNKQIANWSVLYVKLHHYHWFVSGSQFFTLHGKFEELYNDAHQWIDDLAERVLMLHGRPVATLKEMLALATLREAAGTESPTQMVSATVQDFQTIIGDLRQGIKQAEQDGDNVTSDLLTGMQQALEKQVWLLESFNR